MLRRTILYYPTHVIQDESWLRQALLYYDHIGLIVPGGIPMAGALYDQSFLYSDEGFRQVRTFPPKDILRLPSSHRDEMILDYFRLVDKMIVPFLDRSKSRLELESEHSSRVSLHFDRSASLPKEFVDFDPSPNMILGLFGVEPLPTVFDGLKDRGLAEQDITGTWLIEKKTALLYMSVIAQYIADLDGDLTVIGTDYRDEFQLLHTGETSSAIPGARLALLNVLPVPSNEVSLTDIVRFKTKRRDELLRLRTQLDEFAKELSECSTEFQVRNAATRFTEHLELSLMDLTRLLKENALSFSFGCLESFFKANSPGFWTTALSAVGGLTASMPIVALGGIAAGACVQVGSYAISKRNEKRATIRNSPFAYLYSAKNEGIL